MSTISTQLDSILATRASRLRTLDADIAGWQARADEVLRTLAAVEAAERVNPDLAGASATLRTVGETLRRVLEDGAKVRARFARDTLCIGIGGAARMGKSTFLQSVTGLEEAQIPTSDKYFTTAVRSQIENSANENTAIADFHSEESFLREVIAPMCGAIRIAAPTNLPAFRTARFELPDGVTHTQEADDVLQRLTDAQSHLSDYERYLTGERGRRIPLGELRPFVAYPDGGIVKAGPYLAVANLVIRVPFPSTDVSRLRVVDLPGLGEAGRDLAKVQTAGMADVCDVTLLVKRPTDANVQWTTVDTNALDAMSEAVPLLDDQTKYTAILANVGGCDEERARLCVEAIGAALKRPFEIIPCDARNRKAVVDETMPKILDFLARNLPAIDAAILARLGKSADAAIAAAKRDIEAVASRVRAIAPAGQGFLAFAKSLTDAVAGVLVEQERAAKEKSFGNDKEWDDEVTRIHDAVVKWVKDGCGYESREALLEEIRKEIMRKNAQPADVINECRVKFRNEWEAMDLHLSSRIAALLAGVMEALRGVMHDFVPTRTATDLAAVRAQIIAFAERIDARTTDLGDDEALRELSRPLRRIAEFDLQFRFHLEPMLHATTHLLVANELPLVKGYKDAAKFHAALEKKLLEAADAYSSGMRKSGTGNSAALERKKKLFEKAIPDTSVRADVIALLEQSMGSAQSFCPNRIFAAVVETFADAFIRSKNSAKAFQILAREWRDELTPAPDEKTRLTNAAAGALTALVKAF
jgi:hypothetical protein